MFVPVSVCKLMLTQVAEALWGTFLITVGCWTGDSTKVLPVQAAEIYLMAELWRKLHFLFWKVYPSASCLVALLLCAYGFPFPHVESKWGLVNECLYVIARQVIPWQLHPRLRQHQHSQTLGRRKRSATCYPSTSTLIFGYQADLTSDAMLCWRYGHFPSHMSTGWLALWPASFSAPHLPDVGPWTVSHQQTVPRVRIVTNFCPIMLLLAVIVGFNLWRGIVRSLLEEQGRN